MRYVVAVSGPIGAGKTTLVHALTARLGDAAPVFSDSYEKSANEAAQDIIKWADSGADYNALILRGLVEDLEKLKRGEDVRDPLTGLPTPARKHILFETNFGRAHHATAKFIDLLIWVDVPLELALARKAKQLTGTFLSKNRTSSYLDCIHWLDEWLENYMKVIRKLLVMQRDRIRPNADIILDGETGTPALVELARYEILRRLP